jgi:copper transport protein
MLAAGTYTVRWRVISEDGHPINGTYQFSVGAAGAASAPLEETAAPTVAWSIVGRSFHLAALSALVGPLLFLLVVRPAHPKVRQRLWLVMVWGSIALLPAALTMFVAQAAAVGGSLASVWQWTSTSDLIRTMWGRLWVVRTAWAFLAIAVAWLGRRRSLSDPNDRQTVFAATLVPVVVVILTTTAMNGHAAATRPIWVSIPLDWIHLAATAAWLGGLAALATAAFPVLSALPVKHQDSALAPLATRFSTLALVCVELLVVTGLYQSWAHVDSLQSLTSTGYGRALLVKLGLIAAMMVPAAVNLLVIRPRLKLLNRTTGDLYRRFRWTVGTELFIGTMVLVVVGSLTSTQPARVEAAARRATQPAAAPPRERGLMMADEVGAKLAMLNVSPVRVGSNRLEIQLQDSTGAAAGVDVRLRIIPPALSGVLPWTVTPAVDGGHYRATAVLAPAGQWGVEISTADSEEHATAAFAFEVPARDAGELLIAAVNRMNRLSSAVEDVETHADGIRSAATITYRAPDRERWTQGNGERGTEITIGSTRFVRAGKTWQQEPVPLFRWPAFEPHSSADALLTGREVIGGIECLVIAYVNPADGSRHRAWIATDDMRIIRHSEMAPGRVVTTRYSQFDVPVQIDTPVTPR